MKRIFRMTKTEQAKMKRLSSERKKRLGARRACIVAFAIMFGKDLLNYNTIQIGMV